eukprot:CAMPEP_0180426198 /NCGR_PEP_ID=MMETSP1036_2-20121128/5669_1 /TAXON_ID=632150 /ORGANISM="Azadinium spinosum, Strain 3D9" /LENGTH=51 /DNA_ID=CAMNT_0022431739 /DNA_START=298 /DNA_END=453 /DNA_ORIENTATION=-
MEKEERVEPVRAGRQERDSPHHVACYGVRDTDVGLDPLTSSADGVPRGHVF